MSLQRTCTIQELEADQYRSRACKFQATPSELQITAVSVSRFQAKVPCRSVAVVCWSSSSPTTS